MTRRAFSPTPLTLHFILLIRWCARNQRQLHTRLTKAIASSNSSLRLKQQALKLSAEESSRQRGSKGKEGKGGKQGAGGKGGGKANAEEEEEEKEEARESLVQELLRVADRFQAGGLYEHCLAEFGRALTVETAMLLTPHVYLVASRAIVHAGLRGARAMVCCG